MVKRTISSLIALGVIVCAANPIASIPYAGAVDAAQLYKDAVEEASAQSGAAGAFYANTARGALYDIDGNGVDELILLYTIKTEQIPYLVSSIYTLNGGQIVPLLDEEPLYPLAGGPNGAVGVIERDGQNLLYIQSESGETGADAHRSGEWNFYQMDDNSMSAVESVSYEYAMSDPSDLGNCTGSAVWDGSAISWGEYLSRTSGITSEVKLTENGSGSTLDALLDQIDNMAIEPDTQWSAEDIEWFKDALHVPDSLNVQVSVSDRYYWDAGERWLVQVSITHNGEIVAGAAFDADNLEMVRDILMYTGNTDIEDAEFRFYLDTASNCIANGSSAEMYVGLFVNDTLYPNSAEDSYDISVSDNRVVRITADGWSDTLGQLYRLEALQPGSVAVTITDTSVGATGTLELHVVDSEMVYTFDSVPEMTIEEGKTTNFYDFSGLVIDGFQYTERANGYYDVNMTIYNTLDLYAAVTAYDKDGNIYDYAVVDKFKSMDSSFVDSVSRLIKQTGDLFYLLDNERYYSGESISKKTDISIEVPEGGYLEITNNAQSVVPLIANTTGIVVDFIATYGDLALDVGKTLDKKWIAEQVLKDAFSKDYLQSAMVSAIQDTAQNELMNGNWSITGFKDGIQSFFDALTSAGFNLMESITRKAASAAGIASITESAVMNIIPTGHLVDLLYSGSDAGELVIETMAFLKSFERPAGIYIQPEGFTDISSDAYYYDAVQWAVDQEIAAGTSDFTFGPDDACTRSQAVTFLWRAAGSPEPSYSGVQFSDVQDNAYYYDAALWAIDQEITFGVQSTSFAPDVSCNRAQIATFIYRAAGSPETQAVNSFSDVEDDAYYTDAINWVTEQGIATGTSEKTFSPDEPCTRAQIVTFLYRANEKGIF